MLLYHFNANYINAPLIQVLEIFENSKPKRGFVGFSILWKYYIVEFLLKK